MSPESLIGNLQGYKTDNWALGILLYELHMNKEPYPGKSSTDMLQKITANPIQFPSQHFTKDGMNLIKGLVKYYDYKRISIRKILKSDFLKNLTKEYFSQKQFKVSNEPPKQLETITLNYLKRINKNLTRTHIGPNQNESCSQKADSHLDKLLSTDLHNDKDYNHQSKHKISSSSQSFKYLTKKNLISQSGNSKGIFIKKIIQRFSF